MKRRSVKEEARPYGMSALWAMKKNGKFMFGNILMLLELLALGASVAVLVWVYNRYIHDIPFAFIAFINAFIVVSVFYAARFHYRYTMKRYIEYMSRSLDTVFSEVTDQDFPKGGADLQPFYSQLEKLKATLRKKDDTRQEILNVVNSVAVNMDFEKVLEDLLPKLIVVTGSNCCAFYSLNAQTHKLEIKQSVGFSKNIYSEFDINLGEGLIGAAALQNQTTVCIDIPDDSVYLIRTFVGKLKPRNMLIVPIFYHEEMTGVMVFASIHAYSHEDLEMVEMIKYYVGVAVANGMSYERTKRLSNELKFQNKLIQNLNEELEKKVENRSFFLNNIIDSIQDYAIYAMDKNGVIQTWNKGADYMLGFSAEEAVGKQVEFLYPPEEKESVKRRIQLVQQEGKYAENGWRNRRDGSRFFYEMRMFCMYNDKNEVIGISNITKDMSGIKNVESALWFEKEVSQRILETSSRALLFADEEGLIILANHNTELLLDQEFLAGRGLYDFFEDSGALSEKIKATAQNSFYNEIFGRLRDEVDVVRLQISVMFDEVLGSKRLFIVMTKETPGY
ncbi:MAG: PAS domain S-box protein [Clostridiales bacterium]|nr:PAS domain S-box protein [Clostridiales bacterium]